MEYLNVLIGNKEMYIPVNDKLGKTMLLAHKRLNYEKYIARMRHFGNGKMVAERVEISSDFFYALEDILNEQGYPEVIHHLFYGFANEQENSDIFVMVQREDYENLIKKLKDLKKRAGGKTERETAMQEAINRIEEMKNGEVRFEIKK